MNSPTFKRKTSNQLCACGCGEYTLIGKSGLNKGKPNKYLLRHWARNRKDQSGSNNSNWNGGKRKRGGYLYIWQPDHPKAGKKGYVPNACLVVERALGKYLPNKAIVHHINKIRDDDWPKNLVVCEDKAYHNLLHRRQRALKECGHANWLKCPFCKQYDDPKNLIIRKNGGGIHRKCQNKARRKYVEENREKVNQRQREKGKEYRLKNKEKVRANYKKWYYKNKKEKAVINA